jgi:hypothetical protein
MVFPLLLSAFVAIGSAIGATVTTGVASTLLASAAVCTAASFVKNVASGKNNFEIGVDMNIGIGNGPVEFSSRSAEILLPRKQENNETVLLYDSRNSDHNKIFTNGSPTTSTKVLFDKDTGNRYNLSNQNQFNTLLNFDDKFYNKLLSMNTVQEWKSQNAIDILLNKGLFNSHIMTTPTSFDNINIMNGNFNNSSSLMGGPMIGLPGHALSPGFMPGEFINLLGNLRTDISNTTNSIINSNTFQTLSNFTSSERMCNHRFKDDPEGPKFCKFMENMKEKQSSEFKTQMSLVKYQIGK